MWKNLLFALAPGTCVLCEAASGRHLDLCFACEADLPAAVSACPSCGLPGTAGRCLSCIVNPHPFASCFAPLLYANPVDVMIRRFKDNTHLLFGAVLSQVAARAYQQQNPGPRPDLIVPVPLHPARMKSRGFNQSAQIARTLSQTTGVKLDLKLCCRQRDAPPQKSLSARQRQTNLKQAFGCTRALSGEHLLIVDDVMTTGATLVAVTKVLLKAGAERVDVMALARTPLT